MHNRASQLVPSAVLLLLSAQPLADVLLVDASGSGDFLEIQPAVNAALPGDVILVATGAYGPAEIPTGDLTIAALPDALATVLGGIEVRDTTANAGVTLAGLQLVGDDTVALGRREGLVVRDCAGAVRIADVTAVGAAGNNYVLPQFGAEGVWITGSPDVVFSRCAFTGGAGGLSFSGGEDNRGASGLFSRNANVAFFETGSSGGNGGPGDFQGCDFGGAAGHGLELVDTFAFASGGRFLGGDGGGDDIIACEPGGHGVFVSGSDGDVHLAGVQLGGGAGACFQPPGQPFVTERGASVTELISPARTFAAPASVAAASELPMEISGLPGELTLLVASQSTDLLAAILFDGVLLVPPPWLVSPIVLGTLDARGKLTLALPLPALPLGTGALLLELQLVHAGTDAALGAYAPLTLTEQR